MDERATTNVVPSAMWMTLEIFKDPTLLSRVRSELNTAFDLPPLISATFPIRTLITLPLLQSIYAETLRLYVRTCVPRSTGSEPLLLNQ